MPDHLFQKSAISNITCFPARRAPGNLFDAMQGFRVAVVKIVDHNDIVACLDELNTGVRADIYNGDNSWKIAILRYFNPVGAHESGLIGEDPKGIPNNLMPIIAQVATGRREKLNVWGNDYSTPDGTGVRDYIHVVDLAAGHLKALKKLDEPQCFEVNLGTGQGYSVLDVVKAFEHVSNREIKYEIAPRRPGDVAECYADPTFARDFLGWSAEKNLREMCQDMWHWQSKNPNGYE